MFNPGVGLGFVTEIASFHLRFDFGSGFDFVIGNSNWIDFVIVNSS